MDGEDNGNGRVTLAVLGVQIDQLQQQMEEHDRRQREDFRTWSQTFQVDHDTITRHGTELDTLRVDVAHAKSTVDSLKAESRIMTGLASVVAIAAAALGLNRA